MSKICICCLKWENKIKTERSLCFQYLRNGSKGGFEPGLTWLRVRRSTTELPRYDGNWGIHSPALHCYCDQWACTIIVTPKKTSIGVAFICVAKHHSPRLRWYNCKITVHPRKLQHRHYYFNREVSYWLQFSITGSTFCGFIAILQTWHLHVKRYKIDSPTDVCYSFPSFYGNGHMLDPTIR